MTLLPSRPSTTGNVEIFTWKPPDTFATRSLCSNDTLRLYNPSSTTVVDCAVIVSMTVQLNFPMLA